MKKCPKCGSKNLIKSGINYAGEKKQRWLCKDCGRHSFEDKKEDEQR